MNLCWRLDVEVLSLDMTHSSASPLLDQHAKTVFVNNACAGCYEALYEVQHPT
jgi:hypothetical protein